MKYLNILNDIETILNDNNHSFLSYNSLVEEAIKLAIRAKNSNKPIVVIKETNYLVNRLKDILLSYFDDEEMEILKQVYNNAYSNESANDENINNDQETLDNAVKENKIGIVLFNKFISTNVIINNIHNADKYKKDTD